MTQMKKYAVEIHVMAEDQEEALNRAAQAMAMGLVPHRVQLWDATREGQTALLDATVNKRLEGEIQGSGQTVEEALDNLANAGGSEPQLSLQLPPTKKQKRYTQEELESIYADVLEGVDDKDIAVKHGRSWQGTYQIARAMRVDKKEWQNIRRQYGLAVAEFIDGIHKGK